MHNDWADKVDDTVSWFERHAFNIGLGIGVVFTLLISWAAWGEELPKDHPPIYQAELPCPAGGYFHIVTPEADLITLHLMAVTGQITQAQFTSIATGRVHPEQITSFLVQCMGSKSKI